MEYETQWRIFEPGVDESGARGSHEVELHGLITKMIDVTCTLVFEHKATSQEKTRSIEWWNT